MPTDNTDNPKPRKPLTRRQALKRKRKKLRGRLNACLSELSQIEPLLAEVERLLAEDRERDLAS